MSNIESSIIGEVVTEQQCDTDKPDAQTIEDKLSYVQRVFQNVVMKEIAQKGYALKANALLITSYRIEDEQAFLVLCPFGKWEAWEEEESARQQEYYNALKKVSKHLRQVLDEIDCVHRQATRTDKELFSLPPKWHGWIIVAKRG